MLRSSAFLGLSVIIAACSPSPSPSGGTGGQAQAGGATSGGVGTSGATSGGSSTGGTSGGAGTGTTSGGAISGGASSGGASTSGGMASGGAPSGGSGTGGTAGGTTGGATTTGGTASGGAAGGGAGGTTGGAAAGGGSGGSSALWSCPTGITGKPTLTGLVPTRIASVPPPDTFNMNNGTYGNIEGPVWIGDALYVTEMGAQPYDQSQSNVVKSRILKVTSDGMTSIFVADSGSNGMAVDANGNIVAAVHKDGSLTRFAVPGGTATPVATMYMGKRFNTPNDLAIRSDGNIYFTDPTFQAPNPPPQSETRVYRRDPSGNVTALTPINGSFNNPNGVTLSLNEDFLYVAASNGVKYPVMADGSLGAGQAFQPSNGGDGMTIDCAGNLYVAKASSPDVMVYTPDGTSIGTISIPAKENVQVTNVAFGGADHKTLYITSLQNNKGLFWVKLDIPGRPY